MYTGDKKFVNYGKEGISRWIGKHRIALKNYILKKIHEGIFIIAVKIFKT
jgi:hypothetical protein